MTISKTKIKIVKAVLNDVVKTLNTLLWLCNSTHLPAIGVYPSAIEEKNEQSLDWMEVTMILTALAIALLLSSYF